jgi:hypothetical protein
MIFKNLKDHCVCAHLPNDLTTLPPPALHFTVLRGDMFQKLGSCSQYGKFKYFPCRILNLMSLFLLQGLLELYRNMIIWGGGEFNAAF